MLSPQAYFLVLFLVSAYAFVRGHSDERLVAGVCILASVASLLVGRPAASAYAGIEHGLLAVDVLALLGFIFVALRSDRFWPLWVAGLQLTTLIAHALKGVQLDLMPQAYAAAARFWVYPIFLIIVVGTWRSHRRRVEQRRGAAPA